MYFLGFPPLENKAYSKYEAMIEGMGIPSADLTQFILAITAGNYEVADQIIRKQQIYFKGHMYAIGYIISRSKAPQKWRELANALLFAHEKPYLDQ